MNQETGIVKSIMPVSWFFSDRAVSNILNHFIIKPIIPYLCVISIEFNAHLMNSYYS